MRKLIFSDINDTIKTPNGNITDFCKDTLKLAKNKLKTYFIFSKVSKRPGTPGQFPGANCSAAALPSVHAMGATPCGLYCLLIA